MVLNVLDSCGNSTNGNVNDCGTISESLSYSMSNIFTGHEPLFTSVNGCTLDWPSNVGSNTTGRVSMPRPSISKNPDFAIPVMFMSSSGLFMLLLLMVITSVHSRE